MDRKRMRNIVVAITVSLTFVLSSGCSSINSGTSMTKPETGGPGGAGMGALLGQTTAASKADTLSGAGLATEQEISPLANTAWQVVSVNPKPVEPMKSKVGRFNADGTLTTTTTYWDGRTVTDTDSERYRIVGQTLIISQDDYVINATFLLDGDSLYVDTGRCSVVLERTWPTPVETTGGKQPVIVSAGFMAGIEIER